MKKISKLLFYGMIVFFSIFQLLIKAKAADFCVSTEIELHTALYQAESNSEDDVIKLVQGTYLGNFLYSSSEEYHLTIEGGYVTNCSSRDIDPANAVLDGNYVSNVLVLNSDQLTDFTVDGLSIKNGVPGIVYSNAGLFVTTAGGNVTISNNVISDNSDGAGASVSGGNLVSFTKNVISNNSGDWDGGGFRLTENTEVIIAENAISNNYNGGGDIYQSDTVIINNNMIDNNNAQYNNGGGISLNNISTTADFTNNTIIGNTSEYGGGLYYNGTASISLTNNMFINNTANSSGGGLYLNANSITLTNNIVCKNQSGEDGGGIAIFYESGPFGSGSVTLTNNSICYNTANGNGPSPSGNGGGVIIRLSDDHDTANIYNNIVWNNSAVNNGSDFHIDNDGNENLFRSPVNLYSNDFDQSAAGFYIKLFIPIDPSNLNNANPLFADSANDDYHITAGSPCKDAGDNSAPSLPERDMDDEPRIIEGVVDMGADEFVDLCEGDFDTDSDVDGSDLAVFAADFGRTDCASGLPCEGDFDTDNDVDGSDLAVFAADFGRTDCPTSD